MLRPRHNLTRAILMTAAWVLMTGAFANTAAAGVATEEDIIVGFLVDTSGGEADAGWAAAGCMLNGTPIDCAGPGSSWWNGECYVNVYSNDPSDPRSNPQYWWTHFGKTSGVLLKCFYDASGNYVLPPDLPYWAESGAQPSLEDLTHHVYLLVNGVITAPKIGIFPGDLEENNPDAMGLVGVPTWFWSKDPGPGIAAPWKGSMTVGEHTLDVTAELDRTVWDSGDGGRVVCGLGTEAHDIHKPTRSPTRCDHTYMERANYTVTATSKVSVTWESADRFGSFTLSVQRSGVCKVGEVQVLNVNG
jgi:hypothetical protein